MLNSRLETAQTSRKRAEFCLRVMTFNIRGATYDDGVNAWKNRAALNVEAIRRRAPDLIGFQELQVGNLKTYRYELPEYDYVLGLRYNRPGRLFYGPIFWNSRRFKLTGTGGFYLSKTPGKWSRAWEAARVHAVTWVRLRRVDGAQEMLHLNTHLDHSSHWARLESSKLIVRKTAQIRGDGLPTILTGDFNSLPQLPREMKTDPDGVVHRTLMDNGFKDTYLAACGERLDAANTVHGFQGERFKGDRRTALRFDWILTLNGSLPIRAKSCTIVRDAQPPLYPSDHYPVVADLLIGGG